MKRDNGNWHILFCEEKEKSCNIPKFIEDLPREGQVKALKFIELLSKTGPNLHRPYSGFLHDGIHELRFRLGKRYIRILYFFVFGNYIVLSRGFKKKTDRTPDLFVEQAYEYREALLHKYSESELKEKLDAEF